MPLKFMVTDRSGIEDGVLVKSAYIVISIHDTYSPPAKVKQQSGLRAMLQLAFDDAEPTGSSDLKAAFVLMTSKQADEIWAFVEQHREEVGAVVVHCEAGVSRSPAVAAGLCKGMGGSEPILPQVSAEHARLPADARSGKKEIDPMKSGAEHPRQAPTTNRACSLHHTDRCRRSSANALPGSTPQAAVQSINSVTSTLRSPISLL